MRLRLRMRLLGFLLATSVSCQASNVAEQCRQITAALAEAGDPFSLPPKFSRNRQPPTINEAGNRATYANGVVAHYGARTTGDLVLMNIDRPDVPKPTMPRATVTRRRDREALIPLLPPGTLDGARLRGKTVLDVGVGGGKFVFDLRREGVLAFGLDILLDKPLRKAPHVFFDADARDTGLEENQFDEIFNNWSSLYYDAEGTRAQLEEMRRILKPGGTLWVTPQLTQRQIEIARSVPGITMVISTSRYGGAGYTRIVKDN